VARDHADEAELQWLIIRQLRVEIREAEARSMPLAPRPAHARLPVGLVAEDSTTTTTTTMRDEMRALRTENLALLEELMRERASRSVF
jgi:hypothetical protein